MSVYVPPASGAGDGCSGGCLSDSQIKTDFLRSYFNAHALSMPSHRYIYITWFVVALVCIVLSVSYHFGLADQSYIGAAWNRFAMKNRVIKLGRQRAASIGDSRKAVISQPHQAGHNGAAQGQNGEGFSQARPQQSASPLRRKRKVLTFPSFGRMLLLLAFMTVPIVLTIIGADYIRPSAGVFDMSESWPNTNISTYTPGLNRRELHKRVLYGAHKYPKVMLNAPAITLPYKTWWTSGGRTGAMTNGLTPFVVVLALKQIPFALFSTKLLGGIAFDRLSFLHKWGGRFVWLFATLHVILWSVQLSQDQGFNVSVWNFVFLWTRFRWGFVSYGFMTMLVILSVEPVRLLYYEFFYIAHVVCIIGFMVTAWLHHPPLGPWMYVTLLWWLAERVTRIAKVAWINGIGFAGRKPRVAVSPSSSTRKNGHMHGIPSESASSATLHGDARGKQTQARSPFDTYTEESHHSGLASFENGAIPMAPMSTRRYSLRDDGADPKSSHDEHSPASNGGSSDHSTAVNSNARHHQSPAQGVPKALPRPAIAADVAAILRPGFAYAQLLPGKGVRLTLRTPNAFAWKPGQYILLNVPSVRWWQSHPFTIASAYQSSCPSSTAFHNIDEEKGTRRASTSTGEERTIVLLLRARGGFTDALWDHVRVARERQIRHIEETTGVQYVRGQVAKTATGVQLRAIIDGPYGSSQRTRWGIHSTVVIICGGSGVSYGLSVLEHLCATMAGLRQEKGFKTQRVRFIWILREFSHLQWISSSLRRCIELVPPELLQVDLYVTSHRYSERAQRSSARKPSYGSHLTAANSQNNLLSSYDYEGMASTDTSIGAARFTDGPDQDEYEIDANDLVEFAGEDASAPTAAEARINERVHREGKLRRAHTRRATQKKAGRGQRGDAQKMASDKQAAQEAESLASQRAIHDGKMREPQSWSANTMTSRGQMPTDDSRDFNNSGYQSHTDISGFLSPMTHEKRLSGLGMPSSASSQQHLDSSYFSRGERPQQNRLQSSGQLSTQLPISPSPAGTPRPGYAPFGSYEAPDASGYYSRRASAADTSFGAGNNSFEPMLGTTPMSSTMHLGQYPDGHDAMRPHGHSGLAQQARSTEAEDGAPPAADAPIDLDEAEMTDMAIIAELARPGYPKLDRLIKQEVEVSAGRVLVSACGPTSLADLIRSIVSKQIDLPALRAGKLNAHINVATESYEWGS